MWYWGGDKLFILFYPVAAGAGLVSGTGAEFICFTQNLSNLKKITPFFETKIDFFAIKNMAHGYKKNAGAKRCELGVITQSTLRYIWRSNPVYFEQKYSIFRDH